MPSNASELLIITRAKDLCTYVFTVTQKSPKQFRFTFISRMQNLCLDIIENLYRANDTFVVKTDMIARKQRLDLQHSAMTDLRLLAYFAQLSMERTFILLQMRI